MNGFEQAIKAYLDNRAKTDQLFAKTYAKEGKSIEECCEYIIQEVHKSKRQGFADDEIFGMAIHYYDEDNIVVSKSTPKCNVVHNRATQEKFEKPQPKVESKPTTPKSSVPNLFDQPKEQTTPIIKPQPKAKKKVEDTAQLSLF